MNDPSFWSIYCPILAALLSSVVIFEAVHISLTRWLAKRQMKKLKKIQEKINSGEISMDDLGEMFPGMIMGAPMEVPYDIPVAASGTEPPPAAGQYL